LVTGLIQDIANETISQNYNVTKEWDVWFQEAEHMPSKHEVQSQYCKKSKTRQMKSKRN
jgi:hypothetical protein